MKDFSPKPVPHSGLEGSGQLPPPAPTLPPTHEFSQEELRFLLALGEFQDKNDRFPGWLEVLGIFKSLGYILGEEPTFAAPIRP